MTYYVSNKYLDKPTWFVNPHVVCLNYIECFSKSYDNKFKNNPIIKHHHKKHFNDKYAPAWKTIEFMTLGDVIFLYKAIKDKEIRDTIAGHFHLTEGIFLNYINTIRRVRNSCAHGNILYDISLPTSLKKGPIGKMEGSQYHNLYGVLKVISYMVGCVSINRQNDLRNEIVNLFEENYKVSKLREIIQEATTIRDIKDVF